MKPTTRIALCTCDGEPPDAPGPGQTLEDRLHGLITSNLERLIVVSTVVDAMTKDLDANVVADGLNIILGDAVEGFYAAKSLASQLLATASPPVLDEAAQ